MSTSSEITIGPAVGYDLISILTWLKREEDDAKEYEFSGFYCNRHEITKADALDQLTVLRRAGNPIAIAYASDYKIFAVEPAARGLGYGRMLLEYCIAKSMENNIGVVEIICVPRTSIPFWETMGFTVLVEREYEPPGYRILHHRFDLPQGCPEVPVQIRFYPGPDNPKLGDRPLSEHRPRAVRLSDGSIQLEERIVGFHRYQTHGLDIVVELEIDGIRRYRKAVEAESLGLKRQKDSGQLKDVYFIDKIIMSQY